MLSYRSIQNTITPQPVKLGPHTVNQAIPVSDFPQVSPGPFVMNNQTEILEAMRDYQDGKMGFLY